MGADAIPIDTAFTLKPKGGHLRRVPRHPPYPSIDDRAAGIHAGRAAIREDLFTRRMGATARELLKALMVRRRNEDGLSCATLETLTRKMGGSGTARDIFKTRRAMSRLRRAGIVESFRCKEFFDFFDPDLGQRREGYFMCRVVRGKYLPNEGEFLFSPAVVTNILEGYVGENGQRKRRGGAGRGQGRKPANLAESGAIEVSGFDSENNQTRSPEPPLETIKPAHPCISTVKNLSADAVSESHSPKAAKAAGLRPEVSRSASGGEGSSTGTRIGAQPHLVRAVALPAELFFSSLRPATIPSPPKLKEGMSEDEIIQMMLRAFRGATESRFKGERSKFSMATRVIDRKKQDKLLEVAEMLRDEGISPYGWAAFSCDVWKEHHSKPPRLDWVFLVSRVEQRSGWFKSELSDYTGERVVFGPKARELMRRHETMRMLLAQARTDEHVQKVNEGFFPGNLFNEMLEAARAEGDAERTRLREAIDRGEWFWK